MNLVVKSQWQGAGPITCRKKICVCEWISPWISWTEFSMVYIDSSRCLPYNLSVMSTLADTNTQFQALFNWHIVKYLLESQNSQKSSTAILSVYLEFLRNSEVGKDYSKPKHALSNTNTQFSVNIYENQMSKLKSILFNKGIDKYEKSGWN